MSFGLHFDCFCPFSSLVFAPLDLVIYFHTIIFYASLSLCTLCEAWDLYQSLIKSLNLLSKHSFQRHQREAIWQISLQ